MGSDLATCRVWQIFPKASGGRVQTHCMTRASSQLRPNRRPFFFFVYSARFISSLKVWWVCPRYPSSTYFMRVTLNCRQDKKKKKKKVLLAQLQPDCELLQHILVRVSHYDQLQTHPVLCTLGTHPMGATSSTFWIFILFIYYLFYSLHVPDPDSSLGFTGASNGSASLQFGYCDRGDTIISRQHQAITVPTALASREQWRVMGCWPGLSSAYLLHTWCPVQSSTLLYS